MFRTLGFEVNADPKERDSVVSYRGIYFLQLQSTFTTCSQSLNIAHFRTDTKANMSFVYLYSNIRLMRHPALNIFKTFEIIEHLVKEDKGERHPGVKHYLKELSDLQKEPFQHV